MYTLKLSWEIYRSTHYTKYLIQIGPRAYHSFVLAYSRFAYVDFRISIYSLALKSTIYIQKYRSLSVLTADHSDHSGRAV
jgi:hypothetical protein